MSAHAESNGLGGEGLRSLTAEAVAQLTGGRLVGDGALRLVGVAPLDRARPEELSFVSGARYAAQLATTRAGAVLVTPELAGEADGPAVRIVVTQPHEAMLRVLPALYPEPERPRGVHPTAVIGPGVVLGEAVSVGPYAVIGAAARLGDRVTIAAHCTVGDGVDIGDDSRIYPSVTLYSGTRIGRRVRVHAGARLGSDGFGYVFADGQHQKIPHVGRCIIDDDVEIGANSTIDRGSIDDTVIGAGTKIDNLVHIAHNVRVGRLCFIAAQTGIAGSARLGDGCALGGQVGISGHHSIGDGAKLGAQAGVFGDVPAGESWSGYPARPHREALRAQAALFRLAGMAKQLERLLGRTPE